MLNDVEVCCSCVYKASAKSADLPSIDEELAQIQMSQDMPPSPDNSGGTPAVARKVEVSSLSSCVVFSLFGFLCCWICQVACRGAI